MILSLHQKINETAELLNVRTNVGIHFFIVTENVFPLKQKLFNLMNISLLSQWSKRN